MKEIVGETFHGLYDRGDRLDIREIFLEHCHFSHCSLSLTDNIERMSRVSDVVLKNCIATGCQLGPMILSNVTIENLKTDDLLIAWSPYLDRVVLAGDMCKLKVNTTASHTTYGSPRQAPFDAFRREFYASVDWALDISRARFRDFDIEGVPGRLIKRDPESQILVTRERALALATPGWEAKLDPTNKLWPFMINLFIGDGYEDIVLVAPLAAPKAKRDPLLKGLRELRSIGLAEPD